MEWLVALLGFVGGLGAAGLSAVAGVWSNNRRMAADVRARWDEALLERSSALVAAVGSVRHLARRYDRVADKDAQRSKIDQAHEQARVLAEEIRLLGNLRVQHAARQVLHHLYSVRVLGEEGRDPRAGDYPGTAPLARLSDSLQEFYRAVRSQLRAEDPETVLDYDINQVNPGMKPLGRKSRSKIA